MMVVMSRCGRGFVSEVDCLLSPINDFIRNKFIKDSNPSRFVGWWEGVWYGVIFVGGDGGSSWMSRQSATRT